MEGKLLFFDHEKATDKTTADLTGAKYASDPKSYFENIKELITVTNERAPRRKVLQNQGLEDEEIYEQIRKEFPNLLKFLKFQ